MLSNARIQLPHGGLCLLQLRLVLVEYLSRLNRGRSELARAIELDRRIMSLRQRGSAVGLFRRLVQVDQGVSGRDFFTGLEMDGDHPPGHFGRQHHFTHGAQGADGLETHWNASGTHLHRSHGDGIRLRGRRWCGPYATPHRYRRTENQKTCDHSPSGIDAG